MIQPKQIEGVVQDLTKDSVKIQNYWIKFFDTKELTDIKIGDTIGVTYSDNTKNGRTYHNGKSIVKYEKPLEWVNVQKLDTTTINTLLMISKDIHIVRLEEGSLGIKPTFEQTVKSVLEGLKLILNA